MAACIRVFQLACKQAKIQSFIGVGVCVPPGNGVPLISCFRQSFLQRLYSANSYDASTLWDSVTGVSPSGRKKGRGGKTRKRENLQMGQKMGQGRSGLRIPGLTYDGFPERKGMRTLNKLEDLKIPSEKVDKEKTSEFVSKLVETRASGGRLKTKKKEFFWPLERGWRGHGILGKSIGKPDPIDGYEFDGFDSRVMEMKRVSSTSGNLGKVMNYSACVAVGNGKGLIGVSVGKAKDFRAALIKAKNRAAKHLVYIPMHENRTVYHNVYSRFHKTKIYICPKEKANNIPCLDAGRLFNPYDPGHGLVCHYALATLCQLVGMKDLYAKIEGAKSSTENVIKTFLQGLTEQESHQEIADRTGYHVVQYSAAHDYVPIVLATPAPSIAKETKSAEDLALEFDHLHSSGRPVRVTKKKAPFYHSFRHYRRRMFRLYANRYQITAKRERYAKGI